MLNGNCSVPLGVVIHHSAFRILHWSEDTMNSIIPVPKLPITIRPATMDDLPFIDGLQKVNTKQVGWMPGKQLEEKIGRGDVLIAEERHEGTEALRHEGEDHGNGSA